MKLTKPTSPAFSMSGRHGEDLVPSAKMSKPGPGKYRVNDGVGSKAPFRKKAPSFSFGASSRFGSGMFNDSYAPGPGAYGNKTSLGPHGTQTTISRKAPAITMSGRTRIIQDVVDTMGPGVCREDSFTRPGSSPTMKRAPSFTMPGRPKESMANGAASPGPGEYTSKTGKLSTQKSAPSFSLAGRHAGQASRNNQKAFTCRTDSFTDNSRGFTMGRRPTSRDRSKHTPGPGEYSNITYVTRVNSSSSIRSAPAFSFSKTPSVEALDGRRVKTPGPGAYVLEESCSNQVLSTHRNNKGHSFGDKKGPSKRKGGVDKDYEPGPGAYTLQSGMGRQSNSRARSAPSPTMGSREAFGSLSSQQRSLGPGPAAFSPSGNGIAQLPTQKHAPKFQFGTQKRDSIARNPNAPGPGQYENINAATKATKTSAPKFSIGQRLEHKNSRSGSNSGPGAVRPDHAIGKQYVSEKKNMPSFTFGARVKPHKSLDVPGPGAYG